MTEQRADARDLARLAAAYAGRKPYQGELHDHTNSGGTSDGAVPFAEYKREMLEKGIEFAAILDHRQVRHMYLEEFDPALFICGTEPGTWITDCDAQKPDLHYNMLFPTPQGLEGLLAAFPEFAFEGGPEGHFSYPRFIRARFAELAQGVLDRGGFFVLPHPRQVMITENALDFWFCDRTGIEVFYNDLDSRASADNYDLWRELLDQGKRLFACAGGDKHAHPDTGALTTIYSDRRLGAAYLPYLRAGDFTAGNAGVQMLVGETRQGGSCDFRGARVIISAGDLHASVRHPGHLYRLELWDDRHAVAAAGFGAEERAALALDAEPSAKFYRAEVWDETANLRIALGNPVWNAI